MAVTAKPASGGKLLKHSTIYMVGTLSRQLASFLMLPVYTHYLTPADYGVVGLLTLTLSLMEVFFGARLGEAIPKYYFDPKNQHRRGSIFGVALTITGGVSGITALFIFLGKDSASSLLFGNPDYGLVVGLFGIQILTQAIEYYGFSFIRLQQKPILYVTMSLTKLVLQLALNIWLVAFLNKGVMGVVISGGISSSLYAVGLAIYIVKTLGFKFEKDLAKAMLAFSFPLWFAGLASLYIYQSNRYLLRYFGSLDDVGIFELATKFSIILSILAWGPFSQTWEVERFNYYRQPNAEKTFGIVFRLISTILFIVGLGISIFSAPIIQIMSTESFHKAAISVPFLTLGMLFTCLTTFASFSLLVSENTKLITKNNYFTAAAITIFNLLLIPKFGEEGAAIASMLAMVIQFISIKYIAQRYYDMQIRFKPLIIMSLITGTGYCLANKIMTIESLSLDLAYKLLIYLLSIALLLGAFWKDPKAREFIARFTRKSAPPPATAT